MEINFRIFKEHQLLIHQFNGVWATNEYISYLLKSQDLTDAPYIKKIFTDLRNLSFLSVEDTLKDLEEKIPFFVGITGKNYLNVHLVNSPVNVAVIHLYQEMLRNYNTYHYCTTFEQALRHLDINLSKDELHNLLSQLERFSL